MGGGEEGKLRLGRWRLSWLSPRTKTHIIRGLDSSVLYLLPICVFLSDDPAPFTALTFSSPAASWEEVKPHCIDLLSAIE